MLHGPETFAAMADELLLAVLGQVLGDIDIDHPYVLNHAVNTSGKKKSIGSSPGRRGFIPSGIPAAKHR